MSRAVYEPQRQPDLGFDQYGPAVADDPGPAEPSLYGRRPPLLSRLGVVGVAAIVAVLLATFGAAAATRAVLGGGPAPRPAPVDRPTPVGEPGSPASPSAVESFASGPSGASAGASGSTGPAASTGPGTRVTTDPRQESAVVALVNGERERAGCRRQVRLDDRLRAAARAHSTDMASRNFFSHTGSDGSGPTQRMRDAGYDQPLAENLARGQRSAREVVRAWMGSPEHRRNILDCDARAVGVGLAVRDGNIPFWTQDFGR